MRTPEKRLFSQSSALIHLWLHQIKVRIIFVENALTLLHQHFAFGDFPPASFQFLLAIFDPLLAGYYQFRTSRPIFRQFFLKIGYSLFV